MRRVTGQIVLASTAITMLTAATPVLPSSIQKSRPVLEEVQMVQLSNPIDARKLKSMLAKAERVVARAERAVGNYEEAAPASNDRNQASALRAIEGAEKILNTLSTTSEVAGLNTRLEVAKSMYEGLASRNAAAVSAQADNEARLGNLEASGELDRDIEITKALRESIADPFRYKFDHANFGRFGEPAALDDMVRDAENWDDNIKTYLTIQSKYENLGHERTAAAMGLQADLYHIRDFLPRTEKTMRAFKGDAPAVLAESLQDAMSIASDALDQGRFQAFTGLNSEMRMALLKPTAVVRVYEVLPNITDAEGVALRRQYERGLQEIEGLKEKARDRIVAENRFDPDSYSGSDAAAIKAKAKAGFEFVHGKQTILEARIPSDQWTRHQGWRWSKIDRAYSKVDYSTIDAYVFERTNGKIATYWRFTVQKRHLEGGALIADPASRTRHKPTPDQQILLSNL